MKKLIVTAVFLISIMLITACSNENDNATEDTNDSNNDVESQEAMTTTMSDMAEKIKELEYHKFDFDVFYEQTEFEGEIKIHDGIVEAEYYDTFNGHDKRGTEAFNGLFPVLQDLKLNPDMEDEEAITATLKAFEVPDDFIKAELEVTFKDGTEKEFVVKKNKM